MERQLRGVYLPSWVSRLLVTLTPPSLLLKLRPFADDSLITPYQACMLRNSGLTSSIGLYLSVDFTKHTTTGAVPDWDSDVLIFPPFCMGLVQIVRFLRRD
jgi:hypothetical protein